MNATIHHADSLTHLKIVVTALVASILVGCIAIASHMTSHERSTLSLMQNVGRF